VASIADVFDLAYKQYQAGNFSLAEQLCRQIIKANPTLSNAWCFLGAACQTQGKLAEAIECYQTSLRIKPDNAEAHYNFGVALYARGEREAAILRFHQALAYNPDYVEAIDMLEEVLAEAQKLAFAGDQTPGQPSLLLYGQAHYNLGVVRARRGQIEEALSHYREALRFNPDSMETHNNIANLLHQRGQWNEAVASFHQALRCRPDCAEAYANLGSSLIRLGRLEEAVTSYRQALRIKPHFAEAYNNLGEAFKELGQLDQALASFEQALRLKPDFAASRWNRSLLWLLHGDFVRGWPEYEWRWTQLGVRPRSFPQPLWDGSALNGRVILLHAEQGLGDTLHFIRYVPMVKEHGGKVIVECQPELTRLLSDFPGIAQLVGRRGPLPPFDVQAPLLSLPRIFSTSPAAIPASVPYLHADPKLVDHWRRKMSDVRCPMSDVKTTSSDIGHRTSDIGHTSDIGRGLRIGIAWQGSPTYRYDRQRSVPLANFARLAKVPGVQLISLQKGPGTEQLSVVSCQLSDNWQLATDNWQLTTDNFPVLDLGHDLDESSGAFMDTAAVMRNLDLVICSDTVIPHLAGALAVPVWLALSLVPDWRWLLQREDSPWYPTMRLFRQTRCDNWDDVFDRITEELKKRL
jgi:tetratricopeptide (TPR) repeat protein